MSLRVVLYAEGMGEAGGALRWLPPPGDDLLPEQLGAAHALVRRAIVRDSSIPSEAIRFVSPLRLEGRRARGSDLCFRPSLRRLLTWPSPQRRPDLAVVLVDCDGDDSRAAMLASSVDDVLVPPAIGVPKQEFESWLIADHAAVAGALTPAPPQPPGVETMSPREAKTKLDQWIRAAQPPISGDDLRLTLAQTVRLEVLDGLIAFAAFRAELRALLTRSR